MKERDGCLEDSTYTSKIYVVIATCAKRGLTMPTLPLRKPNRGLQKLNTSTAECKKSLGRQGFTVTSTSEKYACQFQLYARFFFRASCANPHRPSAGNSKRVWLFWLDAQQQLNNQLRHASFAWLYPWSYNLCRIMWRWRFAKLWLGTRQRWGWRAWVAKVHCSISCDDATCEVSAATWQMI